MSTFHGFPQAGLQLLQELSQNNNKPWFDAHKSAFRANLLSPDAALLDELGQALGQAFPSLSPTAGGGGTLARIYRDTRFSADKSPYKTNIAMMFNPNKGQRMQTPGFGLQLTPQQVELVVGLFAFDKTQLERYREAVVDETLGPALEEAAQRVMAKPDYMLGGQELKRVPQGYAAEHPRAEWLKYKGLHAFALSISLEVAQTPALVETALAHFQHLAPLYDWLMRL